MSEYKFLKEVEEGQEEGKSHPGETNHRATLDESPGVGSEDPTKTTTELEHPE